MHFTAQSSCMYSTFSVCICMGASVLSLQQKAIPSISFVLTQMPPVLALQPLFLLPSLNTSLSHCTPSLSSSFCPSWSCRLSSFYLSFPSLFVAGLAHCFSVHSLHFIKATGKCRTQWSLRPTTWQVKTSKTCYGNKRLCRTLTWWKGVELVK